MIPLKDRRNAISVSLFKIKSRNPANVSSASISPPSPLSYPLVHTDYLLSTFYLLSRSVNEGRIEVNVLSWFVSFLLVVNRLTALFKFLNLLHQTHFGRSWLMVLSVEVMTVLKCMEHLKWQNYCYWTIYFLHHVSCPCDLESFLDHQVPCSTYVSSVFCIRKAL